MEHLLKMANRWSYHRTTVRPPCDHIPPVLGVHRARCVRHREAARPWGSKPSLPTFRESFKEEEEQSQKQFCMVGFADSKPIVAWHPRINEKRRPEWRG